MRNSSLKRSGMAHVNEGLWRVLIFRPAEGRRLSWPEWLVTKRGGLPARRWSPIPVQTGPVVE